MPKQLQGGDDVVLNESAAAELGVKVGDRVTLRLPVEQAVPADSPLGRRDIQSRGLPRMNVVDIIPDRGLGRFSVSANQTAPQNVFVSRATIADALKRDGQANALLFDQVVTQEQLNVGLDDLGLKLQRVKRVFESEDAEPQTIYDYYSLTSDRLLLPEEAVDKVIADLPDGSVTPVTTYLANAIERLDENGEVAATVPYSTISAINSTSGLPLNYKESSIDDADESRVPIVINSWTAQQLDAVKGMPVRIAYYEPEVEKGREIERFFDAVVTDIVPITKPATPYRRRREANF